MSALPESHAPSPAGRAKGLVGACCLGFLLSSCGPEARAEPQRLVLCTIDTLRADHTSLYGYERRTTPFLEELAAGAWVFEDAFATSSWTAPSMASCLTGVPPRAHGVIDGFVREDDAINQAPLDASFLTLPERLQAAGFRTFAISTNAHLARRTGFDQGFERFEERWWADAGAVAETLEAFLPDFLAAERAFLWLHYFDPHAPHHAREPWFSEFRPGGRREDASPRERAESGELVDLYDAEIRYLDGELRALYPRLGGDATAWILTADHGEAFLEHDQLGHGRSLYDEEIRVPFLVRPPGGVPGGGERRSGAVGGIDVLPTALGLLGLGGEAELGGADLAAEVPNARPVVAELDRGQSRQRVLLLDGWKLYKKPGSVRLYDRREDPAERRDLSGEEPERLGELERAWRAWTARWPVFEPSAEPALLSPEELEALEAMGYLEEG